MNTKLIKGTDVYQARREDETILRKVQVITKVWVENEEDVVNLTPVKVEWMITPLYPAGSIQEVDNKEEAAKMLTNIFGNHKDWSGCAWETVLFDKVKRMVEQEQFQLNRTIHKEKLHDFTLGLEQLLHQYNAHFEVQYDIDYDGNSTKRLVIDFNDGFSPEDMIFDVADQIKSTDYV